MRNVTKVIARNQRVSVGLEVSKRTWKVAVRVGGRLVDQSSMPGEYRALQQYLRSRYPGCRIQVIYEASYCGFGLYDRLARDGIHCVVTPPHTVTEEKNNRVKTDKVDARRLAKVLESEDYKSCHVPSKARREDRQVSRTLIQIQRNITRTMNQMRKFLDFHGIDVGLPAGRWTVAAYRQVMAMEFEGNLQVAWGTLVGLLQYLKEQKKHLRKVLMALAKQEAYRETTDLFASAPGIGLFTAIRLALEWGDLRRFSTGKEFSSFLGLVCSESSSGETEHRGRITGQGNGFVRGWLVECSWQAISRDPALREKYQRVWAHSGNKKKGIVAVARKLAVRLHAISRTREPYQVGVIR